MRVGIDLASVGLVQESIRDHAERYLERVYTEREVEECRTAAGLDAERLASRFAVKEAVMKVLQPGEHDVIPWPTIGVHRGAIGTVELKLTGQAEDRARSLGVTEFAVSLTHEADYAAAVVVATLNGAGG